MRDLIKKVLSEHLRNRKVINEMATRDYCGGFSTLYPEYYFCKSAENYIKNELEDAPSEGKKRKGKKIFKDFEKGLKIFFEKNGEDEKVKKRLIRIGTDSQIFIDGKNEVIEATKLLKTNCKNFKDVTDKKLKEFEDNTIIYFLDENGGYSFENRLPTNYSALAVLFTEFFLKKGAFDGVKSEGHKWPEVAKNWITHSFHPHNKFNDLRPEEDKKEPLSSLDFQELAEIYFKDKILYNPTEMKRAVMDVLKGVRGQGFKTEDSFEKMYLEGKREYYRFAKDYGFVDMFGGVDFIYKANNDLWIPVQVKTYATEPTYLISKLGCKVYVIADKKGKHFDIDEHPRKRFLPS